MCSFDTREGSVASFPGVEEFARLTASLETVERSEALALFQSALDARLERESRVMERERDETSLVLFIIATSAPFCLEGTLAVSRSCDRFPLKSLRPSKQTRVCVLLSMFVRRLLFVKQLGLVRAQLLSSGSTDATALDVEFRNAATTACREIPPRSFLQKDIYHLFFLFLFLPYLRENLLCAGTGASWDHESERASRAAFVPRFEFWERGG